LFIPGRTTVELEFTNQHLMWAIALGTLSAISLPLGSALGLVWKPPAKIIAAMTAFGGGALIAALTVELVAPTALGVVAASHSQDAEAYHHATQHLISMIIGAIIGGLLFISLDAIVNSKGGFLRKTSTMISFFSSKRNATRREYLDVLSTVPILREVPSDHVSELVELVEEVSFGVGEKVFDEGDDGDVLYFLKSGVIHLQSGGEDVAQLESGDVLGEIALVTGAKRTATAIAIQDTTALSLTKESFEALRTQCPELDKAAEDLATTRLDDLSRLKSKETPESHTWSTNAMRSLPPSIVIPSVQDVQEAKDEHGSGAPLAIWLGILLDGIPESFVIGATFLGSLTAYAAAGQLDTVTFTNVIPYTLVAGLFLSNFPEALSSSVGMRQQGWSAVRVFSMWSLLTVLTSIGAGAGYWLGNNAGETLVVAIEGLAAGAMLTMIISAMVPEAIHLGGSTITGLGSLAGFLSAISFKLLE